MIDIVLATNNNGKLKEYEDILNNKNIRLHLMKDLNITSDPDENGNYFFHCEPPCWCD